MPVSVNTSNKVITNKAIPYMPNWEGLRIRAINIMVKKEIILLNMLKAHVQETPVITFFEYPMRYIILYK